MTKTIVVTGINGFVGEHLTNHLHEQGIRVIGVGREASLNPRLSEIVTDYQLADLMDRSATAALTGLGQADAIIHLAGLASVADSFNKPELYENGNAAMTENILRSALDQGFSGRAIVISTGALYDPNQPLPIDESSPTISNSPYAVGKLRAEAVTGQLINQGLDAVIVRPFNHIGAYQLPGFLIPDLYEQLVGAKESGSHQIMVGNLTTKRDYSDVHDVVRAYTMLAVSDKLGHRLYNVASGKSYAGTEVLDALKEAMGLSDIETVIDPAKIRPNDIMDIIGDASRLKDDTGWVPESDVFTAINSFVAAKNNP